MRARTAVARGQPDGACQDNLTGSAAQGSQALHVKTKATIARALAPECIQGQRALGTALLGRGVTPRVIAGVEVRGSSDPELDALWLPFKCQRGRSARAAVGVHRSGRSAPMRVRPVPRSRALTVWSTAKEQPKRAETWCRSVLCGVQVPMTEPWAATHVSREAHVDSDTEAVCKGAS